jgi:hypothetical protein
MTRQDIIDFLERLRKPESVDMLHQWVGSYENNRIVLLRFFKWLYYPDIKANKRSKPSVMDNIPRIKRKETSIYKPQLTCGLRKTMHFFTNTVLH